MVNFIFSTGINFWTEKVQLQLCLPAGSVPGVLKGSLQEEPQLFPHCAGENRPEYLGFRLSVAQCGR